MSEWISVKDGLPDRLKLISLTAFTVIVMFLLCGCSDEITQGEVIEKNYSPAHTKIITMPVVISGGKTSNITLVPFKYYYSDKWEITIQQWNEESKEIQTAVFRVTKEVYDGIEIGSEFIYKEDMEPNYPEYTRQIQEVKSSETP